MPGAQISSAAYDRYVQSTGRTGRLVAGATNLVLAPPGGVIALYVAACCVPARTAEHDNDTIEASSKATRCGSCQQ
jgi:hypothetical protein